MLCADFVRKELKCFEAYHSQYTTWQFLLSSYEAIQDAANVGRAAHLFRVKNLPKKKGEDVIIDTEPVGLAYSNDFLPGTAKDAKVAIKGAVEGCGELHALGKLHTGSFRPVYAAACMAYPVVHAGGSRSPAGCMGINCCTATHQC